MKSKTMLIVVLGCLLMLGAWQSAHAQAPVPRLEPEPCRTFVDLDTLGAVEGKDVQCYYLIVPEQRVRPSDKTIKLGIFVIKSTNPNPGAPLVMAQGGPGGSSIDIFNGLASPASPIGLALRADRDLIAFEQRGTHHTVPFLFCQEAYDQSVRALEPNYPKAQSAADSLKATEDCKKRLEAEGVNLAAYNSEENAHDIADLAKALGVPQVNFYGVSYGTMLGQHLVRLHPEVVKSFILDAIVPLNVNAFQRSAQSKNRSLDNLFAACSADANCNKYYPNLEQVLMQTVDDLNKNPLPIELTDFAAKKTYPTLFTGDSLMDLVEELFYATSSLPALPKMIYDAHHRQVDLPELALSLFALDATQADGMYFSVACAEEYHYDTPITDGVRPFIADEEIASTKEINEICKLWNVTALDATADTPITTDIPALLFSGNYDPITPPEYGDQVASHLTHVTNVVFPVNGHGAILVGSCASQIVKDFVANPAVAPDTSCAATPAAPAFVTLADHLVSPGATYLHRVLFRTINNPVNPQNLLALVNTLAERAILLGLLLLFPLIWLVRWLLTLKKPGEKDWLARIAPWAVLAWLTVALSFVALQFLGVGAVTFGGDLFSASAGLSRSAIWIFTLPWVLGLLTLVIVVAAVLSWRKGYWGVAGRIIFSIAAGLTVLYVISLINVGVYQVILA